MSPLFRKTTVLSGRLLALGLLLAAALSGALAQTAPFPAVSTAALAPQFNPPKMDWTRELRVISGVSVAPNGDLVFIGKPFRQTVIGIYDGFVLGI